MIEVGFGALNEYIKNQKCVIVTEYSIERGKTKVRSFVTKYDKKNGTIETLYGTVEPSKMWAFPTFKEASDFVNAG